MIEVAWLWRKYQPDSTLSKWYKTGAANEPPRIGRIILIALARKLIVSLGRYVETGLVPEGAVWFSTNVSALDGVAPAENTGQRFSGPPGGSGKGRRGFGDTIGVNGAGKKREPANSMSQAVHAGLWHAVRELRDIS